MNLKSSLQHNLMLIPGWQTQRKIVVIESDDWGSIRMTDARTLEALSSKNPMLEIDLMSKLDSLESNDDLSALFDVLQSVKDSHGKPAKITANTIIANPDFDLIRATNFQEYSYEYFTETLNHYPGRDNVKDLITYGISSDMYQPQLHGREHIQVNHWLKALQGGNIHLKEAFNQRVIGVPISASVSKKNNFMAAFDFEDPTEMEQQKVIIREGTAIFAQLFGFRSKSFIASSYIWDSALEQELSQNGIQYLQGIPYQYIPKPDGIKYNRKFHYTGQQNKFNQIYLVRNAFFEPSLTKGINTIEICLKRIELAFRWKKPAIIGSHRVNFIGSINEENRTNNLKILRDLLKKIILKWPEVEFLSSDQVGEMISFKDM